MSELDAIPADVEVVMSESMQRAFRVEGCDPACHCCEESISVGSTFKLAYIKSIPLVGKEEADDEMLCEKCTPEMLINARQKERDDWHESLSRKGFTRKHKETP